MKVDVLLLDVDGVVTDRYAKVSAPVVRELLRLSGLGVKIAFITGRSGKWVRDNILARIPKAAGKKMLFLCEFGSVVLGRRLPKRAMPATYIRSAKRIASLFSTLGYDGTKKTMISMEGSLRSPKGQSELAAAERLLRLMVRGDGNFRVLRSTYAVDVLRKNVGKRGAARFALREFGGTTRGKRVVVIGDSAADLEMARPGCDFYFVGEERPKPTVGKNFTVTRKKFSGGARLVLEKLR